MGNVEQARPTVRITLLGGFRVERAGEIVTQGAWLERRAAKSLVKLLAVTPGHSLHREQILNYLWPDYEPQSSRNSFGKALHAARRALEPGLPGYGASSYLKFADDVVSLNGGGVWIDVDHFEALAQDAIRHGDVASAEAALAVHTGPLLPEDCYADWTVARRHTISDLLLRLLTTLADSFERQGAYGPAIERLNQVLQQDPTREDVHRRLMRLLAEEGNRHGALRQYRICCDVLRDELDVDVESETHKLYLDILANRIQSRRAVAGPIAQTLRTSFLPSAIQRSPATPLVGRDRVQKVLADELTRAERGRGNTVFISGEAGAGKTRLAGELCQKAGQHEARVLWGTSDEGDELIPYGAFVEALEGYVARCSYSQRHALASRYPELSRVVPSLMVGTEPLPLVLTPNIERRYITAAVIRLLTELAAERPVVLVLDDLHLASTTTLQLILKLSRLAADRRWLIVGTYADDHASSTELQALVVRTRRANQCTHVHLGRLTHEDCDDLARALLPGGVPSPALLDHIFTMSRGNPLAVEELVGTMQESGDVVLEDGVWHAPPGKPPGEE